LKRFDEALTSYQQAAIARPNQVESHWDCASLLFDLGRHAEVIVACDRVLGLELKHRNAWIIRGHALVALGRHEEGLESYDRVLAFKPDDAVVLSNRAGTHLSLRWFEDADSIDRCHQLKCAQLFVAQNPQLAGDRLWRGGRYTHDRIRLAYVSGDLRAHPVAHLLAGLFEHHDRSRFETMAISLHASDGGAMRRVVALERQ